MRLRTLLFAWLVAFGAMAADAGSAPAAFGPVVVASGVSELQSESVTLDGSVNPAGTAVTLCRFEYGTEASYGQSAPCVPSPGAGEGPVPVSAEVTGLEPNTLYHYRLIATNANGTNITEDHTFQTLLRAPATEDESASAVDVGSLTAMLVGTVNPHNAVEAYHFVWGTSSAYGSVTPVPDLYTRADNVVNIVVAQKLVGLQPGTTYHFALAAIGAGGTAVGPDEMFTTPVVPLPIVNTGGSSGLTVGEATLSGTIDPEGWDTVYHFEYGPTAAYGSDWPTVDVQAGQFIGGQNVTIAVQNLQPSTEYHYRLVATNAAGTVYGPDQVFSTSAYPASLIAQVPVTGMLGITPQIASREASKRSITKCKHSYKRDKRGKCVKLKGGKHKSGK
jgi:hypothetical protein